MTEHKFWTKDELRAKLPKVGDRVTERENTDKPGEKGELRRGVVSYVHLEHLWYTVDFGDGTHGSYKLPKVGCES